MKYMLDLSERIYDPELEEGISSTEYIFEKYYKSKNPEDYFISFTEIDKLGINPKSKYDTPLGIYTYPVEEFFNEYVGFSGPDKLTNKDKEQKIGEFAPFAGRHPHVWVVKVNRNAGRFIDDISKTYTLPMLEKDLDYLEEKYLELIEEYKKKDFKIPTNDMELIKLLSNSMPKVKYDFVNFISQSFEGLLTIDDLKKGIRKTFLYLGETARDQSYGGQIWNITRRFAKENPVKWNALWRELGYIGVADRSGVGIIHENEKIQALFFSIKAFTVVDKVQNIEASIKPEEVDNLTVVRKALSSKIDKFFKEIDEYMFDQYKDFIKELKRFFSNLKKFFEVYNVPEEMKNLKGKLIKSKYHTFKSVFTNFFEKLLEAYVYDKHPIFKFISVYVKHYLSEEGLLEYDFIYDSYVKFVDDMEVFYG